MRVLALDVGTSSVRAAVEGDEPVRLPSSTDPDSLVETCLRALERAGEGDCVAISCFWHSLLAVDEAGRALTPILAWHDVSAEDSAPPDAFERTGCPPHASFWPAKLAHLRAEQPDVWQSAARFVGFGEYLFARLTGEVRCGLSTASGTGLLNLRERRWDAELLDALALDPDRLPPISDEPLGGVHPPLGDGACSNVGAGCTVPGRAALMIGTSGALRLIRPNDGTPPRRGLFRYLLDADRAVEGGSLSDGGNLYEWLRRTLRDVDPHGLDERPPAGHGLTFLPLLGGERSPGWRADVRGAVAGLSFETTTADLVQAAYEGVAFRFAELLELMPEVEEIVGTGRALLADPSWAQILADVLGRELQLSAVREASLTGAAAVVRGRLGEELPAAPIARTVLPREERHRAYRVARARQRDLYEGAT